MKLANLQNREILVTPNTFKILLDLYHCIARGALLTFFWWLLDVLECSADTLHHQGVNPDLNYLCKLWMCSQLNCIIFFSTKLVMLWNRHSVSIDYKFRKGLLIFWLSKWEFFWKESFVVVTDLSMKESQNPSKLIQSGINSHLKLFQDSFFSNNWRLYY